jgi:hypothetical protein
MVLLNGPEVGTYAIRLWLVESISISGVNSGIDWDYTPAGSSRSAWSAPAQIPSPRNCDTIFSRFALIE